jgi:hypothetical protein
MSSLGRFFLAPLLFATTLSLAQSAQSTKPATLPNQVDALVRRLYTQVVARHPTGIPYGANMKVFAPYLSKALLHKIDSAVACGRDWYRQHTDPTVKPEMAWLESGLFSGQDERTEPNAFVIDNTQLEKNGSFRVYVKLTGGSAPDTPWIWRVAAVVVREDGQFVIDDVIYLKDKSALVDSRLSEVLSAGCRGRCWVGFDNQQGDREKQK